MKTITLLSLLALFIFVDFPVSGVEPEQEVAEYVTATVTAQSGLEMRKIPGMSGETIATIPYGESVVVSYCGDSPFATIKGVKGRWVQIGWKEHSGWVFSAYLKKKMDAPCLFLSGYSAYIAGDYATGEKALITIEKDIPGSPRQKGAILTIMEQAPPCTEITVVVSGVKEKIVIKEKESLKLLVRVKSVSVNKSECFTGTGMTSATVKADLLEVQREKMGE